MTSVRLTGNQRRVRRYRILHRRIDDVPRLEVWIGAWIVQGIRQLAKTKGRETWTEVQDIWSTILLSTALVRLTSHPTRRINHQR